MKTYFLALLTFCSLSTYSRNFYVSSSGGDDNRTIFEAQNASTPWKTLDKLNSIMSSLQQGDAILFRRGDVFYGTLNINKSGSFAGRLVFDAYGTGPAPVITGFSTISAWTSLGNNIWESSSPVSTLPTLNVVKINGVNRPMGRYPNSGFLTYETFSGNTSITSSSLNSGTTNWTGAEAVIKKTKWILDRRLITAHSGGTLTYSGGGYNGRNKYGFFIQNDSRTLDQQNEWYYNPSTKKLRIYSTSSPGQVQVSTLDTLIFMVYSNYVTFSNISLTGSNGNAFAIYSCSNLILQNCTVESCYDGVIGKNYGVSSDNFLLQNCTVNNTCNNAVNLAEEFTSATIINNHINNTALVPGAGGSGDGTYTALGIRSQNCLVKYNSINSVGYNGITFYGNSINVSNNEVNSFCLVKSDGGGIYTQGLNSDMTIEGNIVINGIGNTDGVYNPGGVGVIGIYCDGSVTDIHVLNNSVGNINNGGIYLHNPHTVDVKNNTVYNCSYTSLLIKNDSDQIVMRNLAITNNIFFARDASQRTSQIITLHDDIPSLGTIDNNYYTRPIKETDIIGAQPFGENVNSTYYNLAQWKAYSKLDANSLGGPKTITNVNDLRYEYNATTSDKAVNLDANYIDVAGKQYSGSVLLAPYTSVVLIKTTATLNNPPSVNITAPANNAGFTAPASITITASASDDGSIAKVDFYNGTTLIGTSAVSPYSITWNNVTSGNYSLTAKATDNSGLSATSSAIAVSVAGPVQGIAPVVNLTSPVANASYTDPAGITIAATASDNDGTIKKVEFFNGSTLLSTQNSSPYSFAWTNVHTGTYSITAKATDNSGLATTSAAVVVTVTAPAQGAAPVVNLTSPVANASYKDPATITITASASDPDGSVKKVELFNGATLLSTQNSAPYSFAWKNVHAGTYSITARATDNKGLTTTSAAVSVTVTASTPSGPPVIKLTAPANNATFKKGATITLTASASDPGGSVKKVEFFKGSTLLNTQTSSPYSYAWKNVAVGSYTLTARATDNSGLKTTSAAIKITVKAQARSSAADTSIASSPVTEETGAAEEKDNLFGSNLNKSVNFGLIPNPAVNTIQLYFDHTQTYRKTTLVIYNAWGETVKKLPVIISGKKLAIDISPLTAGVYFIGLSGDQGKTTKKFIKVN